MPIKTYRPNTPTLRFQTALVKDEITRQQPEKSLTKGKSGTGGRNSKGRICIWSRGGGHKRKYREIDYKRDKGGIPAVVASIEYDPNRSSHIALLHYKDGEKRYILAPVGLKVGDEVLSGEGSDIKPGNTLQLRNIPLGTILHNIELKIGAGGQLVRGAGTSAQLMAKEGVYVTIKMPSGEMRLIHQLCRATIGQVGNTDHENVRYGKAGRSRWFGIRPRVRGIAMNPVDHPMGGGEGRSKGNHPQSPWGVLAKGHKTRHNSRTDRYIVQKRKK